MSAPDTDRLEVWREFLISYGALERMLTRALQEECNLALPWFEVMEALHAAGGHMRFMELAEKVMVLTLAEFGPDHERSAIQTYSLGLIAEAAGRLDEAVQRLGEVAEGVNTLKVLKARAEELEVRV